jgi:hypothetical protein
MTYSLQSGKSQVTPPAIKAQARDKENKVRIEAVID